MTQNERIETIREVFPGYTKPLDSMCKRPEYYGIRADCRSGSPDSGQAPQEAGSQLQAVCAHSFGLCEYGGVPATAY